MAVGDFSTRECCPEKYLSFFEILFESSLFFFFFCKFHRMRHHFREYTKVTLTYYIIHFSGSRISTCCPQGPGAPRLKARDAASIRKQQMNWIGHIFWINWNKISSNAIVWIPHNSKKKDSERTLLGEVDKIGKSWTETENLAKNRVRKKLLVEIISYSEEWNYIEV